jgi:hypothetical protein
MLRNCDDGRQKIRRMSEEKGEKGKDGERGRMKDADTNYDIVRMAEKSRTQWQRTRGQRKQRGKGKRSRGQMHSEEERGNKRWSDHRKERQAHIWRSEAERGTSIGTESRAEKAARDLVCSSLRAAIYLFPRFEEPFILNSPTRPGK